MQTNPPTPPPMTPQYIQNCPICKPYLDKIRNCGKVWSSGASWNTVPVIRAKNNTITQWLQYMYITQIHQDNVATVTHIQYPLTANWKSVQMLGCKYKYNVHTCICSLQCDRTSICNASNCKLQTEHQIHVHIQPFSSWSSHNQYLVLYVTNLTPICTFVHMTLIHYWHSWQYAHFEVLDCRRTLVHCVHSNLWWLHFY